MAKSMDFSRGEKWFVVFTKPRQEQLALSHLERQGYHCFLPQAVNPQQRRRRRIEPLFPRYLFLRADPGRQNLAPVGSSRGVTGLVRFGNALATLSASIVRAIQSRVDPDSGLVQLHPADIRPGDEVEVFAGPFCGVKGIVQEFIAEKRATLLMRMLGREARVAVNADQVRTTC